MQVHYTGNVTNITSQLPRMKSSLGKQVESSYVSMKHYRHFVQQVQCKCNIMHKRNVKGSYIYKALVSHRNYVSEELGNTMHEQCVSNRYKTFALGPGNWFRYRRYSQIILPNWKWLLNCYVPDKIYRESYFTNSYLWQWKLYLTKWHKLKRRNVVVMIQWMVINSRSKLSRFQSQVEVSNVDSSIYNIVNNKFGQESNLLILSNFIISFNYGLNKYKQYILINRFYGHWKYNY